MIPKSPCTTARGAENEPSVVFAADGRTIVAGTSEGKLSVWDSAKGKALRRVGKHDRPFRALSLAPDGRTAAWSDGERAFGLWDLETGKELWRLAAAYPAGPVAFSPDGAILVTSDGVGLRFWETVGRKKVAHWKEKSSYAHIAFSPDGRLLAASHHGRDNAVVLWDVAAGQQVLQFSGQQRGIGLAFGPDGRVVVTSSADGTMLVWDVTGRLKDNVLEPTKMAGLELEACWHDLDSADARRAHKAIWALVAAAPQTVVLLDKRVRPVPKAMSERLAGLIADLDHKKYAVREKATAELNTMGEPAATALRAVLDRKPTPEVQRRVEKVLERLEEPAVAERLRAQRIIAILEHIGSARARELVQRLADGAPEARLTQVALAAVKRMGK